MNLLRRFVNRDCQENRCMSDLQVLVERLRRLTGNVVLSSRKQVLFQAQCDSVQLEQGLLEAVSIPVMQLVRLILDHSLETPEERQAVGKSSRAQIQLRARTRDDAVCLQIDDDGRGMQLPLGLQNLQERFEELGVRLEVRNRPGRGTSTRLWLPPQLPLVETVVCEADGQLFALPASAVADWQTIAPSDVRLLAGEPVARVEEQVVAVVRLVDLLNWAGDEDFWATSDGKYEAQETALLVLEREGLKAGPGLWVDTVLGRQKLMIQQSTAGTRSLPAVAGVGRLADGRKALLLDVDSLTEMAEGHRYDALASLPS